MAEESGELGMVIPLNDPTIQNAGPTVDWLGIDTMVVRGFRKKDPAFKDAASSFAPCESNLIFLKQESKLFDDELRKLVNESCGPFISSRNFEGELDRRSEVLRLSLEHRASLRQCIECLQECRDPEKREMYDEWATMFQDVEILWHLCELLHLNVIPGDAVLPRLLEWIQLQFSDCELEASAILEGCSRVRGAELSHPSYWTVVLKLLMQGRLSETRALLRVHSEAETEPFLEADALLQSIPIYTVYCGLSVSEFNGRWRGWKAIARTKLKSSMFVSHPYLLLIVKILGCEELPMSEVKDYCESWYHLMTASLIFTEPTVRTSELSSHARASIDQFGGTSALRRFDYTILALFDGDLESVIEKLLLGFDSGWSAVHLANLLEVSSRYKSPNEPEFNVSVESLIVDYASLLMDHHSLWQVGVIYLEHCSERGRYVLEELLPRVPLETPAKALKVFNIAKDLGLNTVCVSVSRVMSTKHLKENMLGNALSWALLGEDADMCSSIADQYLSNYANDGNLNCMNSVMDLGYSMFISGRLTFLAKYYEFHQLYRDGEIKEAASLIIRMLDSKVAPKHLWLILLTDAMPLLNEGVLSQEDTTVMMACLEELTTELGDAETSASFHAKTEHIRKAIAHSLARTLLSEPLSFLRPSANTLVCE